MMRFQFQSLDGGTQFKDDIVYDVGVRHQLQAIPGVMEHTACLGTIEKDKGADRRYVQSLRELHYDAGYLAVEDIVFHTSSDFLNLR